MEYLCRLALLVLAVVSRGQSISEQATMIGVDDPCAAELGVPSPSDNLSCEFVPPGETHCYLRSELCNGASACFTRSDEGANIAALDCKSVA